MKRALPLITAVLFLFPSFTFAETKEIIAEGAYNMGDGETPTVAESRALLQAKRTAVEEAGTYVESYSKTKNFHLTADEIQVLASGVMEVEVLEKKRTFVGDGFNFWIKIKARVSTDKMEEMAKRVKEKSVVEDYKRIQEAYDKSQREIEELKKQLAGAKGEKEKNKVAARIAYDERLFQANEWFEKGYKYWRNQQYDEAIESYTSAITLNPNFAEAYSNRGLIYANKGQYDKAIEDCNKAIALDPSNASGYNYRGFAYADKGQYDKAINDYTKALELDPNNAVVYYYNSSIAYVNLGATYAKKGDIGRAISNFQKACDLGNKDGCKALQKTPKSE